MMEQQPLRRNIPIAESDFEVRDQLFKTTGTEHDIPKAYLEEFEAQAIFHWNGAKRLLKIAGDEFKDAEEYLDNTISWCTNLTRGRQGMNVVTVLGRGFLPRRTNQGYEIPKDVVPKKPVNEEQPQQYVNQNGYY